MADPSVIERIFSNDSHGLLDRWVEHQQQSQAVRADLSESAAREQSRQFLRLLRGAVDRGQLGDLSGEAWDAVRASLSEFARSRERMGFSPGEIASFMLSLKRPLFDRILAESTGEREELGEALWQATVLVDELGLHTMESFLRSREETIRRQQEELMELSTPVVKLWEGIVVAPLIGTLDSVRTQMVTEALLHGIVDVGATVAIIDITGVPAVDTLVAQHLLKTVAAARLMGAECIISGIRPQIAQTMVDLGIEFEQIRTKGSLRDAMAVALREAGWVVSRRGAAGAA